MNHVELASFPNLDLDTLKCQMFKWHNYNSHHLFSGPGELVSNC